ncbi:MAG: hypothetical protein HY293_18480, partial [Planctomycetes bacterium]|nr:hypothetical protein [Planctomycetota bacterium]
MRRSLGYVVRFPGPVLLALACLLAGSGLSLLGPLLVRLVIDDGISRRDGHRLAVLAGAFLAVEAVRTAVEVSQTYVLRRLSLRLSGALRRDVFHHLQGVSLSWFDATPAGRIVDRVTGDAAALGDALSGGTVGLLRDLLTLVGVTIVALHLDLRFGAITLGSALLVGIPALLIRRSAQKRSVLALDAVSRANSVLEENISGRSVIALFGIESDRGERFDRENGTLLQVSLSSLRMRVFFDAGASVVSALALTLIIGLGGMEVSSGRITAGLLVAFVQYGTSLLGAVRGTAEKAVAVLSGMAAGERIFETLDLPSAAVLRVEPEASKAAERGIVLTTVRFGYRPDVEI